MIRFFAAALLAAGLLIWPETAINAAREAMRTWYVSVAPSIFPFMALLPMLSGPEAAAVYECLLGPLMRPLFGLPGAAAPAIAVGMTAGSPAGALAAVRTAETANLDARTLERLMGSVCGLSPAFLVSGIGASMLGSAADGRLLLRAQIAAQLLMLLLTRRKSVEVPPIEKTAARGGEDAVAAAALAAMKVCGYMMLFQTAAALITRLARRPWIGLGAICLLDLPSGAQAVARLTWKRETRMVALAGMIGWGGLCIAAQNLAAAKKRGVRAGRFVRYRIQSSLLMMAITALQLALPAPKREKMQNPLIFSALISTLIAVPVWIFPTKNLFLNKRKFGGNRRFLKKNHNI